MTGRSVDAVMPERWGLVNHLTSAGDVNMKAVELAIELAAGPRQAIAWTKQLVNAPLLREAMTQMPLAISFETRAMGQPDMQEGTAAFLEHRTPKWPSAEPESSPDSHG